MLAAAFLCHYTYRTIVFPLRVRAGKPAPLSVMLLGMSFCVWNGLLQVRDLAATEWNGQRRGSGRICPSVCRPDCFLMA